MQLVSARELYRWRPVSIMMDPLALTECQTRLLNNLQGGIYCSVRIFHIIGGTGRSLSLFWGIAATSTTEKKKKKRRRGRKEGRKEDEGGEEEEEEEQQQQQQQQQQ